MICELINTETLQTQEDLDSFCKSHRVYEKVVRKLKENNIYDILNDLSTDEDLTAEVHLINIFLYILAKFYGEDNINNSSAKLTILESMDTDLYHMIGHLENLKSHTYSEKDIKLINALIETYYKMKKSIKFHYKYKYK